ncbi:MAG: hypothetical protein ACM30H_06960 [Clostridia bacterium]
MLPARIAQLVSLIPGRVARVPSGTPFSVSAAAASRNGAQLTHLAPFLAWTSPLVMLTKEDQQALGLMAPHGKPAEGEEGMVSSAEDDDDDQELSSL